MTDFNDATSIDRKHIAKLLKDNTARPIVIMDSYEVVEVDRFTKLEFEAGDDSKPQMYEDVREVVSESAFLALDVETILSRIETKDVEGVLHIEVNSSTYLVCGNARYNKEGLARHVGQCIKKNKLPCFVAGTNKKYVTLDVLLRIVTALLPKKTSKDIVERVILKLRKVFDVVDHIEEVAQHVEPGPTMVSDELEAEDEDEDQNAFLNLGDYIDRIGEYVERTGTDAYPFQISQVFEFCLGYSTKYSKKVVLRMLGKVEEVESNNEECYDTKSIWVVNKRSYIVHASLLTIMQMIVTLNSPAAIHFRKVSMRTVYRALGGDETLINDILQRQNQLSNKVHNGIVEPKNSCTKFSHELVTLDESNEKTVLKKFSGVDLSIIPNWSCTNWVYVGAIDKKLEDGSYVFFYGYSNTDVRQRIGAMRAEYNDVYHIMNISTGTNSAQHVEAIVKEVLNDHQLLCKVAKSKKPDSCYVENFKVSSVDQFVLIFAEVYRRCQKLLPGRGNDIKNIYPLDLEEKIFSYVKDYHPCDKEIQLKKIDVDADIEKCKVQAGVEEIKIIAAHKKDLFPMANELLKGKVITFEQFQSMIQV
jgi:hypothetical protein